MGSPLFPAMNVFSLFIGFAQACPQCKTRYKFRSAIPPSVLLWLESGDSAFPIHEEETDACKLRVRKWNLPYEYVSRLKFKVIKYRVAVKGVKFSQDEKYILHKITGSVAPGEILVLMKT